MIFATVGTEKFPFDRFIKILDDAKRDGELGEELFIQIGHSAYKPKYCTWKRFIEFEKDINLMRKARIVITHAGVGSTLLCLNLNKVPIIFPRSHQHGEHLDNHQIQFAEKMESEGKVIAAYNGLELIQKIQDYDYLSSNLKPKSKIMGKLAKHLTHLLITLQKV